MEKIKMKDLRVIEIKGQRVLTTKQLAEAYGTDAERIKCNYNYNKPRFVIGKHIIPIEGDELRDFKARYQFDTQFKYAKSLYLWTEKGALLHAKSLNTDKAWEVYDYLVDFYFRAKEQLRQQACQSMGEIGTPVVNVPENVKIQEALRDVRKYLTAVEVGLDEYSVFRDEADYDKQKDCLRTLAIKLQIKISDMLALRPQIIRK